MADRTPVRLGSRSLDRPTTGDLLRCGAEIVEVSERFYRGIFVGLTIFVGVAALAALVLLPLRAGSGGPPILGVIGASVLVVAMPVAVLRTETAYRALRRWPYLELGVVVFAAGLVAAVFPLHSQLWWPSCTLLMLVAVVASFRRALAYCLLVLVANLLAHVLSGDLDQTKPVSIIGLWIGYIFWTSTVAAVSDRLAAHLLRLNEQHRGPVRPEPHRVTAWTEAEPRTNGVPAEVAVVAPCSDANGASEPYNRAPTDLTKEARASITPSRITVRGDLSRLTARQLQVVALLADGMRYREVAACLAISEDQVQRHVARAVARLGVRGAVELVAVAVAEGMVPAQA